MNDPVQPLRLAAAVITAVVFLASAVAARGPGEPPRAKRIATTFVAP